MNLKRFISIVLIKKVEDVFGVQLNKDTISPEPIFKPNDFF